MDFDDGSSAVINDDFSVTYADGDGATTIISGFPAKADAESFCCFGDFDLTNNNYVLITKTAFSLHWTYC